MSAQASEIQRAFKIAPPKIKEQLCNLKQIFVWPGFSFGLWENVKAGQIPDRGKYPDWYPGSYIAINRDVFDAKVTLSKEEDDLMDRATKQQFVGSLKVSHSDATRAGSLTVAVLAVLSHELGHIMWHRDNIASSLACYHRNFVGSGASWRQESVQYGKRWRGLTDADQDGEAPDLAKRPRDALTLGDLRAFYAKGFASPLAALNPEEDVVETLKLIILRKSGVTALVVNVPNQTELDVLKNRNPKLRGKVECIDHLVGPPQPQVQTSPRYDYRWRHHQLREF